MAIASREFSIINCRARSIRDWRSSREIGLASSLRDASLATEGGSACPSGVSASPPHTKLEAAVTPLSASNRRREIIRPPEREQDGHYRRRPHGRDVAPLRLCLQAFQVGKQTSLPLLTVLPEERRPA